MFRRENMVVTHSDQKSHSSRSEHQNLNMELLEDESSPLKKLSFETSLESKNIQNKPNQSNSSLNLESKLQDKPNQSEWNLVHPLKSQKRSQSYSPPFETSFMQLSNDTLTPLKKFNFETQFSQSTLGSPPTVGGRRPRSKSDTERQHIHINEMVKIKFRVNLARRLRIILLDFSQVCLKRLYGNISDLGDFNHIHKYKGRRFNRILTKNVFRLLSYGRNIFKYEDLVEMTYRELVNPYDILWIERKLNHKLHTDLSLLPINEKIINLDTIKVYPIHVIKRYKNGFYYFSEWKDTFKITQKQYLNLQSNYTSNWSLFNNYIFLLLIQYHSLGCNNFHCSLPPKIIQKYHLGEFFGSPFNTISKVYYSPFEDLERFFGSNGNFFTSKIRSGDYLCNPPFDLLLIERVFERVVEILEKTKNVSILVNIPAYYYTEVKELDKYKDHIEMYKKSKWVVASCGLNKEEYKHYNYYSDKYIPVSDTELILFSNYNNHPDLEAVVADWKKDVV